MCQRTVSTERYSSVAMPDGRGAAREHAQDLELARRQVVAIGHECRDLAPAILAAHLVDQVHREQARDRRLAAQEAVQRALEARRRLILREEAGGAGAQRAQERVAIGARAQHDDLDAPDAPRSSPRCAGCCRRRRARDRAARRRAAALRSCARRRAERCAAEHGEGPIGEHGDETPPIQVVVFGDQNRNPSRCVFRRAPPRVHTASFTPRRVVRNRQLAHGRGRSIPPIGDRTVRRAHRARAALRSRERGHAHAADGHRDVVEFEPERRVGLVHRDRRALQRHASEQCVRDVRREALDQVEARARGDLDGQAGGVAVGDGVAEAVGLAGRAPSAARARGRAGSAARARARARARRGARAPRGRAPRS